MYAMTAMSAKQPMIFYSNGGNGGWRRRTAAGGGNGRMTWRALRESYK